MAVEAARQAALHSEIARKYKRRKREPFNRPAIRVAELRRLFVGRYGQMLPDDDAGRDDAWIMAHHLAHLTNPERRIASWIELQAPWMASAEAEALIAKVMAKPLRWRADRLAARLNLHEAERRRLRITTIGAVDVDRAERVKRRRERDRTVKAATRRTQGAKPRTNYEAHSISRTKPWEALGISRRTWYRAGKPSAGTGPSTA
jgi:hypothetical protein